MKNVILKICLLLGALQAVGCVKVDEAHSPEQPNRPGATNEAKPASAEEANKACQVVATPEPNKYLVQCPVDVISNVAIRAEGDGRNETAIPQGKGVYEDLQVKPGVKYSYQIGRYESGQFVETYHSEVEVPRDLVVTGVREITEDRDRVWNQFRRVYFTAGAKLITYGKDFQIVAQEVYFQNTEILSFPKGAAASEGQNGRNGGRLRILANNLVGEVVFDLSGENGGRGSAGRAPNPPRALPAIDGDSNTFPLGQSFGCISKVYPSNGVDGFAGVDGGPGMSGGNSGFLVLNAKDMTQFKYQILSRPGAGGPGGPGGPGQLGTPKGKSGCPGDSQGLRDGRNGVDGQTGPRGAEGAAMESCIYLDGRLLECQ